MTNIYGYSSDMTPKQLKAEWETWAGMPIQKGMTLYILSLPPDDEQASNAQIISTPMSSLRDGMLHTTSPLRVKWWFTTKIGKARDRVITYERVYRDRPLNYRYMPEWKNKFVLYATKEAAEVARAQHLVDAAERVKEKAEREVRREMLKQVVAKAGAIRDLLERRLYHTAPSNDEIAIFTHELEAWYKRLASAQEADTPANGVDALRADQSKGGS